MRCLTGLAIAPGTKTEPEIEIVKNKLLPLETLLLLIPLAVAAVQIHRSQNSDLTSWRGGGFGMYSDSHPRHSRFVWVTGTVNGKRTATRLYPPDDRIYDRNQRETSLQISLRNLRDDAYESRDWPAGADLTDLTEAYRQLLEHHGGEESVAWLLPTANLELQVVEILISEDLRALRCHEIARRPL